MQSNPNQRSDMQPSRNIAARAGRWSARHRKTAVFGWLLFIVVAFMAGQNLGTKTLTQEQSGVGESGQAAKIVKDSYPDRIDEAVLIQSKTLKTGDPQYRAVVSDVTKRLRETKGVHSITSPYAEGKQLAPVSDDGHSTMIGFEINGATEDAAPMKIVDATVADTKAAQRAHPDFNVEQFGSGSSEDAFMKIFSDDLQKATSTSLPITLILLVLAFGTLVAAGIPLLLAITGVLGTMGVVAALSQLSPVEETINHVILLIGLAVGVDYALFYLRRVREERAAGRSKEAAIEAAAATSGRAVLVSGFTVMIAMAGMYFAGAPDVHVIRHRHHRGGRSRDARIAHGAPRPAVDARRSHREGPDSRPGPSPQPGGPRGHLVADRGPRPPPSRCCRPSWPRACSWRWRSRRSGWTSAPRTPRPRCRRTSRWCRRSITSRRRSRPRPRP